MEKNAVTVIYGVQKRARYVYAPTSQMRLCRNRLKLTTTLREALSAYRAARRCYPLGESSCIGWDKKALGRPLRYRIQAMSDIYCKLQTQNEAVLVGSLVCRLPPAALAPRLAKYGKR